MSVDELTVYNDTGTYACAEGDHDEIFETAGCAVCHFADSGGVGVVGNGHGYVEFLFKHCCQGYCAFPDEVGGVLDVAGIVVGVGSTYTDAVDFVYGVVYGDEAHYLGVEFFDVVFDIGVFCSLDGTAGDNGAASVNDAEYGVCTADVNS